MSEISRVTVVGGGLMGSGIAQVCASAKLSVVVQDVDSAALERTRATIEKSLGRFVKAGKLEPDAVPSVLGRIAFSTDLATAVDGSDLVIEAAPESLELKQSIFRIADERTGPSAILASNTSNLSITAIASVTSKPDRVIGMHWFNPPPVMKLLELIRGVETSDDTVATVLSLSERFGKQAVVVKDVQGFVVTRLVSAMVLEAFRMLDEGVATKEDIDTAVRLGLNHPMGPFELIDLTGLDTTLWVAETMTQVFGDRFRAPTTLRNMVAAGRFGRKSGKGMYDYS